jgi:predicted NAD/FAD-binding protein/ubiquinone/menaquinone biosynthesis C-methylase UbiE
MPPTSIAVVGSGITGLACAYILSTIPQTQGQDPIHVTVFETEPLPGMDAHSVDLPVNKKGEVDPTSSVKGRTSALSKATNDQLQIAGSIATQEQTPSDTQYEKVDSSNTNTKESQEPASIRLGAPPRAFSPNYYPHLWQLYKHASIAVEKFDWSMSLTPNNGLDASLFHSKMLWNVMNTGIFLPASLQVLQRWFGNSVVRAVIIDGRRFLAQVRSDFPPDQPIKPSEENMETLRDYLERHKLSETYIYNALLPMLSMICTCSYEACFEYPMHVVATYFNQSNTSNQYRTANGTWDTAHRLLENVHSVKLGAKVINVGRGERPTVTYIIQNKSSNTSGPEKAITESFDHVILTAPSNYALEMLGGEKNATELDKSILGSFAYEKSWVAIHGDPTLMPANKEDWAPVNFIISKPAANTTKATTLTDPDDKAPISQGSMCTLISPSSEAKGNLLFQSWNPLHIPSSTHLHKLIPFYRPVQTKRTIAAIRKFPKLQGEGNVWFAGAYAEEAIPLQESGVASAVRVCRYLGVDVPWLAECERGLKAIDGKMEGMYGVDLPFRSLFKSDNNNTEVGKQDDDRDVLSMNYGWWDADTKTIKDSHTTMIQQFGSFIGLTSTDSLACIGIGCGDDVLTLQDTFNLKKPVYGIEPVKSQLEMAKRKLKGRNVGILQGVGESLPLPSTNKLTKVVALDCGYHFNTRNQFYKEAWRVLKGNGEGVLGMLDLGFNITHESKYLSEGLIPLSVFQYLGVKMLKWVLANWIGIPYPNQVSGVIMKQQLESIGFSDVTIQDWTHRVFPGFFNYVKGELWKKVWREQRSAADVLLKWLPLYVIAFVMKLLTKYKLVQFLVVRAVKEGS